MALTPGEATAILVLTFWLATAWVVLRGGRRIPRLATQVSPHCHAPVSVIVPARNEAEALPRSVPSLVAQTYPSLEVIATNDRSTDSTGQVLDSLKGILPRLEVIHLASLPAGWLGKTHALFVGSSHARGDWLLFTDADVIFHPRCLEAAIAWAEANQVDHLVLIPRVETVGFWEKILVSCFGLLFALAQRPWSVSNPRSRAFIGIGAFNLIRRSAYQAVGTHRALANAVVDDVELGRLVKRHGLRQAVVRGEDLLQVRWQIGLRGVVRGMEKNAFASLDYSLLRAVAACLGMTVLEIAPFLMTVFGPAAPLWAAAALTMIGIQAVHAHHARLPAWTAIFHPLAIAVLIYAIARSTVLALCRGTIEWRGTHYPLATLRRRSSELDPPL